MLRFVLDPGRHLCFDVGGGKLPGHGAWLKASLPLLKTAIDKKMFNKAFHNNVIMPENLLALVRQNLYQHILNFINLAKRSGILVLGENAVRRELQAQKLALVVVATDASARQRDNLPVGDVPLLLFGDKEHFTPLQHQNYATYLGFYPHALTENIKTYIQKYNALQEES